MPTIAQIRKLFQDGQEISLGEIRPVIVESWKRSRAFGVSGEEVDQTLLSAEELAQRISCRQRFYDIAIPMLESLYQFTKGSGFMLILSDEEGYILRIIGDPEIMQISKNTVEGANRSERIWGTNGVGTVLETKEPIQVFGDEHYYSPHVDWVCSGAPIFHPDGSLAGSLCLSGMRSQVTHHTLGMAVATAEAITRHYKMQATYDELEVTRSDLNIMLENSRSGILLMDRDFRVQRANTKAAQMLFCSPDELRGAELDKLVGSDFLSADARNKGLKSSNQSGSIVRDGVTYRFSISIHAVGNGNWVVIFEKEESVHRRVNRIIGSEARFRVEDIVGQSATIGEAKELAEIAAGNKTNVLLLGESGTGKEVFAQAIHNASDRRDGPFIAINCAAIPKSLIESELFGYEGGSFTGSKREGHAGKFELANGGTILLDEIGDMPFDVQASLLRVLQNREVTRLGSTKSIKIDVRIIAATNQDLSARIQQGLFRRDLYYRLNVFTIQTPPLHARGGDVRLLADYFLRKYAAGIAGCRVVGFTQEAYERMERYAWPGNVRELENAVERAVYLGKAPYIAAGDLMLESDAAPVREMPVAPAASQAVTEHPSLSRNAPVSIKADERERIERALRMSGGNVKRAAELLEISRRTLYRKLDKYRIDCAWIRENER